MIMAMIIVIIMIITPESILIFPPSQGSHKGKLVPDLLPQLLDLLRIWTFYHLQLLFMVEIITLAMIFNISSSSITMMIIKIM